MAEKNNNVPEHPMEKLLRMDRIPHIWCPTCGIGTAVSCGVLAIVQGIEDHRRQVSWACRSPSCDVRES